jgi:hypothetical protein
MNDDWTHLKRDLDRVAGRVLCVLYGLIATFRPIISSGIRQPCGAILPFVCSGGLRSDAGPAILQLTPGLAIATTLALLYARHPRSVNAYVVTSYEAAVQDKNHTGRKPSV